MKNKRYIYVKMGILFLIIVLAFSFVGCKPVAEKENVPTAAPEEQETLKAPEAEKPEAEQPAEKEAETEQPAEKETETEQDEPAAKKKMILEMHASYPAVDKMELLREAELVLHGKVVKQTRQYFTQDKNGNSVVTGKPCANVQVTEYEVEILKFYKGEYKEETILLNLYNGSDLSAELFTKGEDDNFILAGPLRTRYLEVGKKYVLTVRYSSPSSTYGDDGGYKPVGIFAEQENGRFVAGDSTDKKDEITLDTLAGDVAAAREK